MNYYDIVVKTPAGLEELKTRSGALPQRLRSLLVMIDGTRSSAQLHEMAARVGAPPDGVQRLEELGFIGVAPASAAVVREPSPPAARERDKERDKDRERDREKSSEPAPATPPTAASALTPALTPDARAVEEELAGFRAAQKFMNDSVVDALGLRAFFFTLKLERCYKRTDLTELLPAFTVAITKGHGPTVARELEEKARRLLE